MACPELGKLSSHLWLCFAQLHRQAELSKPGCLNHHLFRRESPSKIPVSKTHWMSLNVIRERNCQGLRPSSRSGQPITTTVDGDGGTDKSALSSYFNMLNEINAARQWDQPIWGALMLGDHHLKGWREKMNVTSMNYLEGLSNEIKESKDIEWDESKEDEEGLPVIKCKQPVEESLFPWRPASVVLCKSMSPDLKQILMLLNNWANDPTFVDVPFVLAHKYVLRVSYNTQGACIDVIAKASAICAGLHIYPQNLQHMGGLHK
ncbi:hypothetical protein BU15DRAFT_60513 [Melanogaster broomeanus]|nr:hypothetical protein BU15DRAFT_60513 [Melanogaster broomeanus]